MKNTLHKIILFLSVFLFSWGYGQTPAGCNTYRNLNTVEFSGISVSATGWSNSDRLVNSNLTDYADINYEIGTDRDVIYSLGNGVTIAPKSNISFLVNPNFGLASGIINYTISTLRSDNTVIESTSITSNQIDNQSLGSTPYEVSFATKSTETIHKIRFRLNLISGNNINLASRFRLYYGKIMEPCSSNDANFSCNVNKYITKPNQGALINTNNTGTTGGAIGSVQDQDKIVDGNSSSYAYLSQLLNIAATYHISVLSPVQVYSGSNYTGFEIQTDALLDVNLLGNITVKTYLNGKLQESSSSGNSLLSLALLNEGGRNIVGFNTTLDFNEVKIEFYSTLSLPLGNTRIYNLVVRKNCPGPLIPECNKNEKVVTPTYPASVVGNRTGFFGGVNIGTITGQNNVLQDNDNYAEINVTLSVAGTASFSVRTTNQAFSAGTFTGFDLENSSLLNASLLGGITIKTYLNGVLQESSTPGSLLLNVGVVGGNSRSVIGFVTTKTFDEVQYNVSTALSLDLIGSTKIYNLVIKRLCEGLDLECNVNTMIGIDDYPVIIGKNTKLDGLATVGSIQNAKNILDKNPSTYATINIAVGALSTATIAVEKSLTPFPKDTYVSFDVELYNVANISVLPKFKIRLLRNGAQIANGITEGGNFLVGAEVLTSIRKTLGFKAPGVFDEIQLIYEQPAAISLGGVNVYDLNIMKPCVRGFDCKDEMDVINTPNHPVVINYFRTGPSGLTCTQCSVQNPENLINSNPNDYASLNLPLGVGGSVGVSIHDLSRIYPSGTRVGFSINDNAYPIQADLLETISVTTYLNGAVRQTFSGSQLLDISILFSIGTGRSNYGFRATLSFDEVEIKVSSVASIFNTIQIYNLKIDASSPTTADGNLICIDGTCVKPGSFETGGLPTNVGISTLENKSGNWPQSIPNGFLTIESKNKGFVITRIANANLITDPKEGMLIYDTTVNCVKLYKDSGWKCLVKSCNE